MEPSQNTPAYINFEGAIQNGNEISSFHEVVGGVGLSNLSEIEKIVAEGSQLSRIDSSEVHINVHDRFMKEDSDRKLIKNDSHVRQSNGFAQILKKDSASSVHPKTNTQSARQSSINASKQGMANQHFQSTNEPVQHHVNFNAKSVSGHPLPSNESSKQTTVLGSLTSNFQTTQQKKQV